MEENRDAFLNWLKEIGAEQINSVYEDESDYIEFEHGGKKILIYGIHLNNSCAGLGVCVEDK